MNTLFTSPNPVADSYKKLVDNNFTQSVSERPENVFVDEPLIAGIGKPETPQPIEEGVDDHDKAYIYSDPDSKHTVDHVEQHSAIPYVNPDLPENKEIRSYSRDSTPLNHGLHQQHSGEKWNEQGGSNSPRLFGYAKEMFSSIEGILNKHQTTDDRHVFTGVHHDIEGLFKKHADAQGRVPEHITIHHPAFLSTSSRYDIVREFAKRHLHDTGFDSSEHPIRSGSKQKDITTQREMPDGSLVQKFVRQNVLKLHVPKGTHAITMRQGRDHMKIDEDPKDRITLDEKEILLHRGHDIKIHRSPNRDGRTTIWHAEIVRRNPKFTADEHSKFLDQEITNRTEPHPDEA